MAGELNYKAGIDIAGFTKSRDEVIKSFKDMKLAAAGAFADTKPLSNYKAAQLQMQESLRNARLETQRLKQEQQSLRNQLEQGRVTQQAYRTELARIKAEQATLTAATKAARDAQTAASGSYKEAQLRLRQLGDQIKSVAGGFAATGPIQQARIKEYNQLNDKLKAFDATMGNHGRNVGNYRSALQGVGGDLVGLASAYLSAGAALQYVLKTTMEFQRIKTPLTFILGSEGDANNKLAELKKLADGLGIEYFKVAESYKSFSAAARASNFDLTQSEKIFTSVTKASAVLGLSSDQMSGALLALQQMISKGNVQAEELRGQLSERLPGAFSLAAKAMGVTEKELNKLLQSGSVLASDLLPKLATQLDKAYGDKAAQGIHGLNAEVNKLYTALQSFAGQGSFLSENLFEPIVSGAASVVNALGKGFRGTLTENFTYMFSMFNSTRKQLNQIYDLRESRNNNRSALTAASSRNLTGSGLGELRTYYSQLDLTFKKAALDYETFKKGVADGTIKETNDASLASYARLVNGLAQQRNRVATELVKQKQQMQAANKDLKNTALTSINDIKKEIARLSKLDGSAIIGSDINNQIEALKARLKKGSDSTGKAEVSAQRSLQSQIDALTKKGVDKQLSANEQEVEAVADKYKKLRDLAIRFNNDPTNKKKGLKVDASGLYKAESNETTAVINKQAAAALKVTLDEQKKLYTEYEDFKSKVGKEKADARYKDLINTDITYMEKLKQLEADQLDPQKSKGGDEGQANPFAMKLLAEQIAAEKIVQQKKYDDLVTQFMSYADKRKKLTEEFNATMLALENDPSAQAEKREAYERELGDLDDSNAKKLSAFQALFNGVDRLSDENAKKVVSNAEVMLNSLLASGKISKELAAEIRTLLSNTTKEISDRMPERIINLANQIDRVADAVGEVDEGFGKMLHTVGNVVGQVGNIKKGLGDFKLAQGKGDVLGQLSAGLGIFGAGLSIVSGISKLFDRSAAREAQQAYATENQVKQNEALNKALERQVALINDAYGTDKLAKYAEAQATILKNEQIYTDQLSKRYSLTGNKEVDDILSQVNATGNTALLGFVKDPSIFDKYKIPVNDLKALQALLDAGKLDDSTAKLVQNLIDAKQAAVDLANQLSSETIGSSLDSIADDFIKNLTDGTQDFGKSFEDVIRTSILNGFKGKLIQQQLQGFYDQFAKATSDANLTPDEIETLRKAYLAASEKAKKDFEDLEQATGISLSDPKDSTLTKNIKGITSDQASALEGITRGQYDLTKQLVVQGGAKVISLTNISNTMGKMYDIAVSHLTYQIQIERNTASTVAELQNTNKKLDKVISNTSSQSSRGLTG